jgi:hypothetical protein
LLASSPESFLDIAGQMDGKRGLWSIWTNKLWSLFPEDLSPFHVVGREFLFMNFRHLNS